MQGINSLSSEPVFTVLKLLCYLNPGEILTNDFQYFQHLTEISLDLSTI